MNYAGQKVPSLCIGLEFSANGKQYAVSGKDVYIREKNQLVYVGTVCSGEKDSRHKIIEALGL